MSRGDAYDMKAKEAIAQQDIYFFNAGSIVA